MKGKHMKSRSLTHFVPAVFLTVIFLFLSLLVIQQSLAAPEATIPVAPIWLRTMIDNPGTGQFAAVQHSSLTIDSLDVPHLSYYDTVNGLHGQLKYARRIGGNWVTETVDTSGGAFPSLDLDSSEYPRVSYYLTPPDSIIKYAILTNTGWISEVVSSNVAQGGSGFNTSLALDHQGNPHIVYPDYSLGHDVLWYAYKTGAVWITSTVDAEHGRAPAIALDSLDHAHILYTDRDNDLLRYAEWTGSGWISETIGSSANNGASLSTSPSDLAMDNSDHANVAYFEQPGNVLVFGRKVGGIWITDTIATLSSVGEVELALGKTGEPQIAFTEYGGSQIGHAYRQGLVWKIEYVTSDIGRYISFALDSADVPRVSYTEVFSRRLYSAVKPQSVVYLPIVLK
jgi:hypothetical protein